MQMENSPNNRTKVIYGKESKNWKCKDPEIRRKNSFLYDIVCINSMILWQLEGGWKNIKDIDDGLVTDFFFLSS